jgi:hypothetical protein
MVATRIGVSFESFGKLREWLSGESFAPFMSLNCNIRKLKIRVRAISQPSLKGHILWMPKGSAADARAAI